MKTKLTVILVNYNSGAYLKKCISNVYRNKSDIDLDIWVVDNNSQDYSLKETKKDFPNINYIENRENLGFGKANNQVLNKISNEFILILNPDTKIAKDTLKEMVNYMEAHPEVGAATCKGVLENGKMDWGYHRGFPTPWASFKYYFLHNDQEYHLTNRDMTKPHEVDAISGSFFFTKKSVLDKVGLFDEDYWMYAEDIDLCYRIKKAGYKIMFLPNLTITHIKGLSSGIKEHSQNLSDANKASKLKAFNSFYQTMKIFYQKNLANDYPFFINWLVNLGINLKWFLAKRKMKV